jgi:hypothetical protein
LLYQHVESKEALFQLALLYAIDPHTVAGLATPLWTPAPAEALRPLADWAGRRSGFTALEAALADGVHRGVRGEFHDVVDELYSVIEDNRAVLLKTLRLTPERASVSATAPP